MYVLLQVEPTVKAIAISSDKKTLVFEETDLYRSMSNRDMVRTKFQIDEVQVVEELRRPLPDAVTKHLKPND